MGGMPYAGQESFATGGEPSGVGFPVWEAE
jgi:hypothetical protein